MIRIESYKRAMNKKYPTSYQAKNRDGKVALGL